MVRRLSAVVCAAALMAACSSSSGGAGAGVRVSHATFANGGRSLPTTIWRPANGGRHPLLVFGQGRGGHPSAYSALLTRWTRAGFVVAAPHLPNRDFDLVAHDLDAVLNGMASRPEVDATRMAVAGHSLGAIHAMAVARNSCCRDRRLRAAVILAGTAREFDGGTWQTTAPPTLFVHGDRDTTVAYANGRAAYRFWPAPKLFVTLHRARHSEAFTNPVSGATDDLAARATTDFLRWAVNGDESALAALRMLVSSSPAVAGLEEQLTG